MLEVLSSVLFLIRYRHLLMLLTVFPSSSMLVHHLRFNRETLDVNADNRLPASHRLLFLINSLALSAAPVYLFSQIFDMPIPENAVLFGGVSVVSAVMLTMACQVRSKGLVARLINKRGIELKSSIELKVKDSTDEKAKLRLKVSCTLSVCLSVSLPLSVASPVPSPTNLI